MKVGDILTYSYHYTARYPQFVRITKITPSGKSIAVEKLQRLIVSDDGYGQNGTCVADTESAGVPMAGMFRIKTSKYWRGGEIVKIDGQTAYLWDGTPEDFYTD